MDQNLISFKGLENSIKKLSKDVKKYQECILDVTEHEKRMTSDLSNSLLCHEDEKTRSLVEEWHSFIAQANSFDEDLILITHRTIGEPLKKFQGVFTETKGALKKRDQSMQDCMRANQKVQKLQEKEKTGANIVKLEAAKQNLTNLEQDFRNQDRSLKSDLPLLYEGRIEYFQPCLEALIKAQVEHSGNSANLFSENIPSLKKFTMSELEFKQLQNQRLSQIHALSIVGDN
ncbi:bridging integrator 3 homolog isoform X2 [Uloborus diversus]|uniref:bridging integrator 3 homolog isoform X2 n=1 Tax=Uloborus diversus TaxID=327109 RepID=UPI002409DDE8|nr:bridging integrator 3 homolog isoform X2 [Uloborus diversus]